MTRRHRACTALPSAALAAVIALAACPPVASADRNLPGPPPARETVLIVGDTQHLAEPPLADHYVALGRWIHEHAPRLGVRAVFIVGDLIETVNDPHQGGAFRAFLDQWKDDGIPWGICLGNHDYDGQANQPLRGVEYISRPDRFPMSLVHEQPWFEAAMTPPHATADEPYLYSFTFTMQGEPHLGISCPYHPTAAMWAWVRQQCAAHPDHRVWLITHAWLDQTATLRQDSVPPHFPGELEPLIMPAVAWRDHLRDVPNLFLAAGGHYHGPPYAQRRTDTGHHGNPVHSLFVNAQESGAGGDGFLHLLRADGEMLRVRSLRPLSESHDVGDHYVFSLPMPPPAPPSTLATGLTHYLRWSDEAGSVVDVHGGLDPALNLGGAVPAAGVADEPSVRFAPSSGEHLRLVDPAPLHGGVTDWSMDFWAALDEGAEAAHAHLASFGYEGAPAQREWSLRLEAAGRLQVRGTDENGVQPGLATSTVVFTPGVFHHVALEYDRALEELRLSVDREPFVVRTLAAPINHAGGDLTIGGESRMPPSPAMTWPGRIVPGARWARILPAAQWDQRFADGQGTSYEQIAGGGLPAPCPADVSDDAVVNGADLVAVISQWGPCAAPCPADLDHDGDVDGQDLLNVILSWGPCPE